MGRHRLKHFRGRSWAAAGLALALCSLSLTSGATLDPAHLESWKLPNASLFGVASQGQNVWACPPIRLLESEHLMHIWEPWVDK